MFHSSCALRTQDRTTGEPGVVLERTKTTVKVLTTEKINDQNSFVFWTFLNEKETT